MRRVSLLSRYFFLRSNCSNVGGQRLGCEKLLAQEGPDEGIHWTCMIDNTSI